MKFDSGVVEVSGIRRVVFGERGGRQNIYERDGNRWYHVDCVGQIDVLSEEDKENWIADSYMVRCIKGAACNSKSRVVINGDTVNIGRPKVREMQLRWRLAW
jgi:hypothetical protein